MKKFQYSVNFNSSLYEAHNLILLVTHEGYYIDIANNTPH